MPGFVKTPADEKRWADAKKAAGKSTRKGSESYWKLSNYIFHKSGDTEENARMAEEFKKSIFISASSGMPKSQASIPNPSKVGSTAVKTPKSKKMPDPFGKRSLFFKSEAEEFAHVKHPTLMKLKDFLLKKHKK